MHSSVQAVPAFYVFTHGLASLLRLRIVLLRSTSNQNVVRSPISPQSLFLPFCPTEKLLYLLQNVLQLGSSSLLFDLRILQVKLFASRISLRV